MIAFVSGQVSGLGPDACVIDVGGVGIEVVPSARCRADLRVGESATVPTAVVVREDSWTVYGFADADERGTFRTLQAAKGVGPKVALGLLGCLTPEQLRVAVATGDARALTAAPGIGAKGAQRLVLDLRDRLAPPTGGGPTAPVPLAGEPPWRSDVQQALQSLGWSAVEAARAVDAVASAPVDAAAGQPEVGAVLRLALQHLNGGGVEVP